MDTNVKRSLRDSYGRSVKLRDRTEIEAWKRAELDSFAARLYAAGKKKLLEIGSGPGQHALYMQDKGLELTCTDLSPEMAAAAGLKG